MVMALRYDEQNPDAGPASSCLLVRLAASVVGSGRWCVEEATYLPRLHHMVEVTAGALCDTGW
jgi:hypothetical protein